MKPSSPNIKLLETLRRKLSELEPRLCMAYLDYTRIGINYHCIRLETRQSRRDDYEYSKSHCTRELVIEAGRGSPMPWLLISQLELTRLVRLSRQLLRLGGVASDERCEKASETMNSVEGNVVDLERAFKELEEHVEVLRDLERTELDGVVPIPADTRGLERWSRMTIGQRAMFHNWALELQEVKAAFSWRIISHGDVDRFVLDDVDRPVVGDWVLEREGMGEVEAEVEQDDDGDDGDVELDRDEDDGEVAREGNLELLRRYGPGAAVQLL